MKSIILIVTLAMFFFSFRTLKNHLPKGGSPTLHYFNEIFKLVQINHYKHLTKSDWNELQLDAEKELSDSSSKEDVMRVIYGIFKKLNDTHSHFVPTLTPESQKKISQIKPFTTSFKNGFAIINVIGISSLNYQIKKKFINDVFTKLDSLDKQDPKAWIIDLTNDQGGSSDARLAAFGPLMNSKLQLRFINNHQDKFSFLFNEGVQEIRGVDGNKKFRYIQQYHSLKNTNIPIFVIIGPRTASAGEHLALALQNEPNVTTLGQNSLGKSSGIQVYNLSDGRKLALAVTLPLNNAGKVIEGPLEPKFLLYPGQDYISFIEKLIKAS